MKRSPCRASIIPTSRSCTTSTTHTATGIVQPQGTQPYTVPEQLQGDPPAPTTDIYSAGVTLYELVTGRMPFNGSQAVVIDQILHKPPEPPRTMAKHVSATLDGIILKAMDKRPERRYQTARELQVDLERCADQDPFDRPHARWPCRRILAAAAVVVVVSAAGIWRLGTDAAPPAPVFPARGWAVVGDFDNRTGDAAALDQTVHESLRLALQQSAYVNVFSREQVFGALERMRQPGVRRVRYCRCSGP